MAAAANFVIATIRLPKSAAMITFLDLAAIRFLLSTTALLAYCFVAFMNPVTVPWTPLHETDCELSVAVNLPLLSIEP